MNTLLDLFKLFFSTKHFTGVLDDDRTEDEKQLDPVHEEVAAGGEIVTWTSKPSNVWKTILPHRDQDGSSGCLSFATATSFQNNLGKVDALSAHDIYQRRMNYPDEGMIPFNALQIAATGVAREVTFSSDNLSEAEMNVKSEAEAILRDRATNTCGIPVKFNLPVDMDQLGVVIDKGISIVFCVRFTYAEWTEIPQLISKFPNLGHGICSVDRTLYNGVKAIIIQDQWKIDSTMFPGGLRVLSEPWLKARCFFAGYILPNPNPNPTPLPAPVHVFTTDIQYGDKGNEVTPLQTKLHNLGFLKVNPTGSFYGLTKQAVIAFQAANGVPQTGYVGALTRAKLNT